MCACTYYFDFKEKRSADQHPAQKLTESTETDKFE
jgi:hypothetical protein